MKTEQLRQLYETDFEGFLIAADALCQTGEARELLDRVNTLYTETDIGTGREPSESDERAEFAYKSRQLFETLAERGGCI